MLIFIDIFDISQDRRQGVDNFIPSLTHPRYNTPYGKQ